MARRETQLWLYPEEVAIAGAARVADLGAQLGVEALSVAVTYHQCVRVFPRYGAIRPGAPGELWFDPDPSRYRELVPRLRAPSSRTLAIRALRDACDDVGLGFHVWLVALDNERLALEHQRYAAQTLDGAPTVHALCPSHSTVRDFVADLAADVVDQFEPELVELEAALYPRWNTYLTEIALEPISSRTRMYATQCLCAACRAMLADAGIDVREARRALAEAAEISPAGNYSGWDDVIAAVADARDRVVGGLIATVTERLQGAAPVRLLAFGSSESLSLQGLGPMATSGAELLVGLGTASGQQLRAKVDEHRAARYGAPAAFGLNWTPDRRGEALGCDAIALLDRGATCVSFYNLSLLPDRGLVELQEALSMVRRRAK